MLVGRRRWTAGGLAAGAAFAVLAAGAPANADPENGAQGPGRPLPLEQHFDNTAVSRDGHPGEADFDGSGNSLSAQDLSAAGWTPGQRLTLDAARLEWPRSASGKPDNVRSDGQAVRLHGSGNAVSFLVAGTSLRSPGGAVAGTGTIRYADGSTSSYTLTAPDWRTGSLATKAVALPHINTPAGQQAGKARLYAVSVPVERGRTISSVILPKDPGPDTDLHVFAAAVRTPVVGSWTGSWAASPAGYTAVGPWTDRTLRLVVHSSSGGRKVRIRLANTFAGQPVEIGHASVAAQAEGATAQQEPAALSFGGRPGARIPAGAQLLSDPLGFTVPAGANLLVSIHLPGTVTAAPVHSQAIQRSFISARGSGDRTGESGPDSYTGTLTTWPFLTGVDVGGGPGTVVALGDSITDGVRSTRDANHRWPDVLAERLRNQDEVPRYGVLNHGISANRIVTDRYPGDGVSTDTGGVSAQHRLDRDVLSQTGARTVVVFEGINDVRWGTSAADVVEGLKAIAERSRARGLRVVAATIAPCEGYHDCTPEVDARRTAVNTFLRANAGKNAVFDALLDFDAVVRDPSRPSRMRPEYDSGDHLHPGDAGLRALAESIDLRALES
ncbi:SGNH/GDSL hydrolase family protein [Streptomyces meridianus]|uniref:SGNH/GDSL hydrolase family protein n=1 Tax=Streptomyces meridianus TaxID=2938945 RepID=A0ABT0X2E3_9ACTN|nr:SGNH/GDSL hydrolase family protein [Streptomyces meridianus]MCM2576683.1 SGNH/GDSL hydrolase family protein [Streptomyces meridianus]